LPLVLLLNMLTAICLVCWIGAFSYKTRDLLHLTPFITYFGIWITPVFFTYDILPEQLRFIWFLNPMAGVVDGWRSCLFAGWEFNTSYLPSMLAVLPVTFGGLWIYCRKESQFSDFI
jgi:lipopolysaccharide transport system permease protein